MVSSTPSYYQLRIKEETECVNCKSDNCNNKTFTVHENLNLLTHQFFMTLRIGRVVCVLFIALIVAKTSKN
jgi:hypothetical protein